MTDQVPLAVLFLYSPCSNFPRSWHDDALEVERVGVPGVVEDHPRVGVVRQEDLQHLCQHLRPEVGQRRVDRDECTQVPEPGSPLCPPRKPPFAAAAGAEVASGARWLG